MTKALIATLTCTTIFALTAVANADTETPAAVAAPAAATPAEPATAPVQALLPTELPPAAMEMATASPIKSFFTDAEWYFSWGYNTETWGDSNIHVSQPGLGNDFTIHNVKGHDEPGFNNIIKLEIFVPQYNIRIGRFIDEARTWAVELNFDHTKYTATVPQTAKVTGTVNGVPYNGDMNLTPGNFRYDLHNGANHLMVNLVKRLPLYGKTNESYSLAGLLKGGLGLVIPHSENVILGNNNNDENGPKQWGNYLGTKHGWWQFDGVTTGIEAGFRFVVAKPIYLELTDKVAYAYLYDVPVYHGTATQSLWMNEVIFSMGFTYDGPRKAAKK